MHRETIMVVPRFDSEYITMSITGLLNSTVKMNEPYQVEKKIVACMLFVHTGDFIIFR